MRLFRFVILLVTVAIVAFPAGTALAYSPADPVRALPDTVERGETFNITVNFTAPADNFTAISLNDFSPAGWNVTVSGSWSQPSAQATTDNNSVEFAWVGGTGGYDNGTNFTALYKVTVPCGDELGNYSFGDGFLGYYIGNDTTHYFEDIIGDFNVTLVGPAICSASSVAFYAAYNGTNPPNQTLDVWSSTPCMLNWSLSDDVGWLEEYPTNGTCTDVHNSVNLSVNSSGMALGNYTANISIESPDASNSPRIVPVTLTITLTGVLKGQVDFTGRGGHGPRWIQPFEVKLFQHGNLDNVLWEGNATTDDTGLFTISDVAGAIYDVGIKNATCLSMLVTNVTINSGSMTLVDFGEIREGDANNDDYVDGSDFGPMSTAWLSWPGEPNWDRNVDFNRDDYIDGSDFGMLSINWLQWGDLYGI